MKEGIVEDTTAFDPAAPDGVQVITWTGVTVVDELDEVEIRSASGVTLALGERDMSFAEPEVPEPVDG